MAALSMCKTLTRPLNFIVYWLWIDWSGV